jgi:uncharacterized protein YwgA
MLDSNDKLRAAILARMVCKAPDQKLGRTQLMKLFYFLQDLKDVSLGYDFRLFTYGPFDSEVLSDLGTACNLEIVKEEVKTYARGYGYEITPTPRAEGLSQELERTHSPIACAVDDIVRQAASYGAGELELRSTILFVDREYAMDGEMTTKDDIAIRTRGIKPHFDLATILQRVNDMDTKGWLQSVGSTHAT